MFGRVWNFRVIIKLISWNSICRVKLKVRSAVYFEQGVGPGDFQRSFPVLFWFYSIKCWQTAWGNQFFRFFPRIVWGKQEKPKITVFQVIPWRCWFLLFPMVQQNLICCTLTKSCALPFGNAKFPGHLAGGRPWSKHPALQSPFLFLSGRNCEEVERYSLSRHAGGCLWHIPQGMPWEIFRAVEFVG